MSVEELEDEEYEARFGEEGWGEDSDEDEF